MAAKVKWERGAWWVFTHYEGKRKKRRVGPSKAHHREAEEIARKINAALALGTFAPSHENTKQLPCDEELRRWHRTYAPTFSRSFEISSGRMIERDLNPHFKSRDLQELGEEDLLGFVNAKLEAGQRPRTIETTLSVLRRVLSLAHRQTWSALGSGFAVAHKRAEFARSRCTARVTPMRASPSPQARV
jgi:hypothetical protein